MDFDLCTRKRCKIGETRNGRNGGRDKGQVFALPVDSGQSFRHLGTGARITRHRGSSLAQKATRCIKLALFIKRFSREKELSCEGRRGSQNRERSDFPVELKLIDCCRRTLAMEIEMDTMILATNAYKNGSAMNG